MPRGAYGRACYRRSKPRTSRNSTGTVESRHVQLHTDQEGCMRATTGWLTLCAAAALGLTIVASEKPPESYVKNMKETNAAAQELRKNLDANDYEGVAKNAAALKTL